MPMAVDGVIDRGGDSAEGPAAGRRVRAPAHRGPTVVALAAIVALAIGLAGCGSSGSATGSSSATTSTRAASAPTTGAASTTTTAGGATTSVTVPVEPCATTVGVATTTTAPLPLTVKASVPASLAGQVSSMAAFGDTQGIMQVIAPRGWTCRAQVGADGSGWVMVVPTGTSIPTNGQQLPAQGIVASETSACVSCTLTQACPLFPAALTALHAYNPSLTCATLSAQVTLTHVSATEARFSAPAGVQVLPTGTGATSGGGPYPVEGVMTWSSANTKGAWTSTCTLPASSSSVCGISLTAFGAAYAAG